jgi:hypothetical protein
MGQFYNNTAISLTAGAPYNITVAAGPRRGNQQANITFANNAVGATAVITIRYFGKQGETIDTVQPGAVWYSYAVWADDIQLLASANAVVALDVRYPQKIPPQNFTVSGSLLSNVTVIGTDGTAVATPQDTINAGNSPFLVYTCPASTKAYLSFILLTLNIGSGAVQVWISRAGFGDDWITQQQGVSMGISGYNETITIGGGPGNDLILPPDMPPLLPGDEILVSVTSGMTIYIQAQVLQMPT